MKRILSGFLAGDLHAHTFLSDGSHTLKEVLEGSFKRNNLEWLMITDHGGAFDRDPRGKNFPQDINIKGEKYGKKGHMWRWQSLLEYGSKEIDTLQRDYPDKLILHGLEYNLPTKGHAGVYIDKDSAKFLSRFEYLFDYRDKDRSLGTNKYNVKASDALKAAVYLEENFPKESFFILNHPHAYKAFTPRQIRTLNDKAPNIVCGFEGLPGHQFREQRGCYMYEHGQDYYLYRTYGGADYMLAKVGGLWDSLLGEGRRFFVFSGSDFHKHGDDLDPFPGEYNQTFLHFNKLNPCEFIQSIRLGRAFIVAGKIIKNLEFSVKDHKDQKGLGEELQTKDDKVLLELNVYLDKDSSLVQIDLIEGEVKGKYAKESTLYDSSTNPTTEVTLRIKKSDLRKVTKGQYSFRKEYPLRFKDGYLRLRGTNCLPNTPLETDAAGNPLIDDHLEFTNTKKTTLADSWFYTNPIFYKRCSR